MNIKTGELIGSGCEVNGLGSYEVGEVINGGKDGGITRTYTLNPVNQENPPLVLRTPDGSIDDLPKKEKVERMKEEDDLLEHVRDICEAQGIPVYVPKVYQAENLDYSGYTSIHERINEDTGFRGLGELFSWENRDTYDTTSVSIHMLAQYLHLQSILADKGIMVTDRKHFDLKYNPEEQRLVVLDHNLHPKLIVRSVAAAANRIFAGIYTGATYGRTPDGRRLEISRTSIEVNEKALELYKKIRCEEFEFPRCPYASRVILEELSEIEDLPEEQEEGAKERLISVTEKALRYEEIAHTVEDNGVSEDRLWKEMKTVMKIFNSEGGIDDDSMTEFDTAMVYIDLCASIGNTEAATFYDTVIELLEDRLTETTSHIRTSQAEDSQNTDTEQKIQTLRDEVERLEAERREQAEAIAELEIALSTERSLHLQLIEWILRKVKVSTKFRKQLLKNRERLQQ